MRQNTGILYILTYECASRHSGIQFFDIGTSKSAPRPSVFYDFDFKMCFSLQRRAIFQHLNFKKCTETVSFLTFLLANVLCASRHSGVQFFDIATSKSGPRMSCFVHFHFKMCLAPQPRAIFQHLNFKKCSETVSFLTFLLGNVLRATAACWEHSHQVGCAKDGAHGYFHFFA